MADGQACDIRESVSLSVKIRTFSWKFKFFVMEDCPVLCILGVDFLSFAQINLNFGNSTCAFAFEPSLVFQFESLDSSIQYNIISSCVRKMIWIDYLPFALVLARPKRVSWTK
jgi:hypothetical protein